MPLRDWPCWLWREELTGLPWFRFRVALTVVGDCRGQAWKSWAAAKARRKLATHALSSSSVIFAA